MPDCPAANVVLAHLVDFKRAHHPRFHAGALDRVLQRQRVDHRGQHAHVITGDAVHARFRQPFAAEDIAAADHQRHLHARVDGGLDLGGNEGGDIGINAERQLAQQCLAGELQQNARVNRLGSHRSTLHAIHTTRPRFRGLENVWQV